MRLLLLSLLFLPTALLAQDRQRPFFRGHFGFSGGSFAFENDPQLLDDRTDAALFLARFEATNRHGIGGGVRYEGFVTDDDLFLRNGAAANEGRSGSLFAHFTFRQQEHRFAMPVRVGVFANGLTLEENTSRLETSYASIGPYFEIEPEVVFVRRGAFRWSGYGVFGFGVGITGIEIDNDPRDYYSATAFAGVEIGTRVRVGHVEIGAAYIGRFQSMDESDPETDGGISQFVFGHDADYNGLLVTFGVVF